MTETKLPSIPQEKDQVNGREIVFIGVVGTVVTALGIAAAAWMLSASGEPVFPEETRAPKVGPEVVGQIEQTLILEARRGPRIDTAAAERVLSKYRWVDRERGLIAVPIDRAIEASAEDGRPE